MPAKDRSVLSECIANTEQLDLQQGGSCKEHPLDTNIVESLTKLRDAIRGDDDDYEIFNHRSEIDSLWKILLEKSIKCLRYYDEREPFKKSSGHKQPLAYGIDTLRDYYKEYGEFERILYGSSRYYRDHVVHVFRTWLTGISLLTRNRGEYLSSIRIHDSQEIKLEPLEKISMWTLIALTHDLGYPLQKAKSIIDQTRKMVSTFIANPNISIDFAFHGVQNDMNDFILRLMSSKMVESPRFAGTKKETGQESGEKDGADGEKAEADGEKAEANQVKPYVTRLQSKYYFKFQKSLEKNDHGILSVLIIYKMLTYFLESDYSLNEDYGFTCEDRRQFYIRREILRAIAAHTCDDIYQMYIASFSVLLRICDDTQEWGRKNLSELYVPSKRSYELEDIGIKLDDKNDSRCMIRESVQLAAQRGKNGGDCVDTNAVKEQIHQFRKQAFVYIMIFRDGQDTEHRDFSFTRQLIIGCNNITTTLTLKIPRDSASELTGEIQYSSTGEKNEQLSKGLLEELGYLTCNSLTDRDEKPVSEENPADWYIRKFTIDLSY